MLKIGFWRKGDTLIEVTIAIGIFTLVAISVVSVVSISTSGAQSALEETLTREEVDAQAETLRFIQSAYVNDKGRDCEQSENANTKYCLYEQIWKRVTKLANNNMNNVGGEIDGISNDFNREFKPEHCDVLYEPLADEESKTYLMKQNAFIIDIRRLNDYDERSLDIDAARKFANDVVIEANSDRGKDIFTAASTYPHLVYKKNSAVVDEYEGALINTEDYDVLDRAEGIFVVGVADANKTNVVTGNSSVEVKVAYYDFYVHSCWYNTGSETPSVVSTMIRLRDPDTITAIEPTKPEPTPGG